MERINPFPFAKLAILLSEYLFYAGIGFVWFVFGVLAGWVMAFQWATVPSPLQMPLAFLILTIPHALLLGFLSSIVTAFFSLRAAIIVAALPIIYVAAGGGGFFVYMLLP